MKEETYTLRQIYKMIEILYTNGGKTNQDEREEIKQEMDGIDPNPYKPKRG